MPPAYVLDEPTWLRLDAGVRDYQSRITRLEAENKSMRASLAGWKPAWWALAGAAASGIALGWWAHSKI